MMVVDGGILNVGLRREAILGSSHGGGGGTEVSSRLRGVEV
jgi:hypothetical protein